MMINLRYVDVVKVHVVAGQLFTDIINFVNNYTANSDLFTPHIINFMIFKH